MPSRPLSCTRPHSPPDGRGLSQLWRLYQKHHGLGGSQTTEVCSSRLWRLEVQETWCLLRAGFLVLGAFLCVLMWRKG